MRMDKVTGLVGQMLQNPVSRAAPALGAAPATAEPGAADLEADSPATLPPGDPLEAVEWSAHPVDGAVDPGEMLRGAGPWIFELGPKPVSLTLRLTDTDRLSRIRLRAATGTAAAIPRGISIVTNSATDPARPRLSSIPAPDMSPDGEFDLRIGERFAHTVTVTILSAGRRVTGPAGRGLDRLKRAYSERSIVPRARFLWIDCSPTSWPDPFNS